MKSIIKTILATLTLLTLVACGGGEGAGSGALSTAQHLNGIMASPIFEPSDIKSNLQASPQSSPLSPQTGISRPQHNQITLRGTTYTFNNQPVNSFAVDDTGRLAVTNSDALNLGFQYARITMLVTGRGLDSNIPQITEVILVQTSEQPTPISNLPNQANVQYTGYAGAISPTGFDLARAGTFTSTVDFANPQGTITGTVRNLDGTYAGEFNGQRGTGNDANTFSVTYDGNGLSDIDTANVDGRFYGPNGEEMSGIGTGTALGGLNNVLVGMMGRRQ